ncbi:MAG TPA: 2-isopropylmalate synthase [Porticoccaceae bacterium]|nr:2-isopropylmalate synthase [Gammaproteobacteria bacterium]HIL59294.1 2-isopropylmalate synthase [Porticoccaceae bacterium]
MDTTLRDGEQTQGVSFSVNEKVNIARALLQTLKVDRIEVASAGVSEGEKQAVSRINEWAAVEGLVDRVEILGFVDYKRSADWIVSAGGKVINLLSKGSEKHCREQLGKTLESHVEDICRTVEYAKEQGLKINMYLEDWSGGYADSKDYVLGLINGTKHLGIGHYLLPDTLGLMAPWEVHAAITEMLTEFPEVEFDFHPHNDYGLATANIMAAVEAGISNVHCTVNCLGERAGNASLAEVVVGLRDKMGMEVSIDESHIAMLSRMVENFSGKFISANTPIIGADVFTQTAGIHADGDLKGDLYVTNLSPERFSRKRIYALGKLSGKASLINNLDELGISLTEEEQAKVLQRIVKLGDSKHVITSEDLPFIIADVMESKEYHHISLLNCYINTGFDIDSTASVRVSIEGEEYQGSGSGNGGFDAFIDAIQKILETRDFEMPVLVDYEVHIPRGGKSTALTECMITWEWQEQEFKTRGVDSNQVLAAVKATLRMINVRLHVDSEN